MRLFLLVALAILSTGCTQEPINMNPLPDFDRAWNFGDPVATRESFHDMMTSNPNAPREWQLELLTQIARTHGLVGEFDESHRILDDVEKTGLTEAPSRLKIRYLLERGRALNSGGDPTAAKPLFVESWETGKAIGEDRLAVDAAHMVAIAVSGTDEATTWNLKALELARNSDDEGAQNWVGSLTNNMGWEAFDAGEAERALALFEESRNHFDQRGLPERERIARWSIARAKRELGLIEEALNIQLTLRSEHDAAGTADGFVYEELGELYLLKGEQSRALESFREALPLLEDERWLVNSEPARLERIREMLASP